MVENIVIKFVRKMQEEKLLDSKMEEYNVYALITLTEKWLTIITIMVIALAFKRVVPTVFFLLFFFSLRKRTGGYHAPKFWMCYMESNAVYIGVLFLCPILADNVKIMYILLALSACAISCMGTVNHPNMDMNEKELHESKIMARYVLSIELMLIVGLAYAKADLGVLSYMAAAVILCAILMCCAKVLKQEV